MTGLQIFPIVGLPEFAPGDDLAGILAAEDDLQQGDVLIVTQKVVSKAEGRLETIDTDDPRGHKAIVERESARILRRRGELIISETQHGFICANAGLSLIHI